MTCPKANAPLPPFPDPQACGPDTGPLSGKMYITPPSGDVKYPVLSSRPIIPSELIWRKLGEPCEITLATDGTGPEVMRDLQDALPDSITDAGDGMIKIKVYLVL